MPVERTSSFPTLFHFSRAVPKYDLYADMTTRQAIHTDLQSLPSSVNTSFIMRLVYLAFRLISQPTISQVSMG